MRPNYLIELTFITISSSYHSWPFQIRPPIYLVKWKRFPISGIKVFLIFKYFITWTQNINLNKTFLSEVFAMQKHANLTYQTTFDSFKLYSENLSLSSIWFDLLFIFLFSFFQENFIRFLLCFQKWRLFNLIWFQFQKNHFVCDKCHIIPLVQWLQSSLQYWGTCFDRSNHLCLKCTR